MAVDKTQKAAGWEAEYDTIRELLSHKFGLLRFPNPLEADVRENMRQRAVATLRESYWMIFVLYLAGVGLAVQQFAAPWRLRQFPDDFQVTMWMFTITGIAVGIVAVCIRFKQLDRWHIWYITFSSMIALISLTIAPSFYTDAELRQHASYFVIYVLFIIYGVANLRVAQGALIGFTSLAVSFLILFVTNQTSETSMLVQYGVMANLVGCGNAYVLEVRDRRLYLQSRMLELEKRQLNRLSERMVQLAREDGLTGLANRRHFNDSFMIEWERARREQQSLALIFVDVDHFKAYNDQHGHLAGDYALCLVAHTLRNQLRPKDSMARYGGEEFVILLPEIDAEEARSIGERLRQSLEQVSSFYSPIGILPGVTVSIGMAPMKPQDSLESLIARADCALYQAKQHGRNCLCG